MSVILRQGLKYSIVGYLGFLLGTLANFFIFPNDLEFYGKLRFIFPTAEMFVPIVVFGISFSNVKFFAQTQKDGKHQNMLSLSLVGIFINFFIFGILYILIYKRIAIPNIFENLFPKLANTGAFCLFFFAKVPENLAFIFFISVFFMAMLGYFLYNNKLEKFHFDFSTDYFRQNGLWVQILSYSFFGFLGNIGSFLALKIANVMIGEYIGFEQNGLYSNIYSIVTLINIPQMGLYNISAPMINKHLTENTLQDLDRFHKKTSLSLFFLGLVFFSCIVVGFPFLTDFMKNGELLRTAEPILWIIGMTMLFDLATGFTSHIISMSKFYKYNTLFMLILAVVTIALNAFFLKYTNLGILGIAISYAVSLTSFNLIKIVFNYRHFKVFPLSIKMIWSIIICGSAIVLASVFPNFQSSFVNLIYKPALVLVVIFIGNLIFKIYPLNQILQKYLLKKSENK